MQPSHPWKEAASTLKMAGISFDGDVRKMNLLWFMQQLGEIIKLQQLPDIQKRVLLKSVFRGHSLGMGKAAERHLLSRTT